MVKFLVYLNRLVFVMDHLVEEEEASRFVFLWSMACVLSVMAYHSSCVNVKLRSVMLAISRHLLYYFSWS